MTRKPTTNPQIDGQPMSFVRIGSRVAGILGYMKWRFTDSRGVPYTRDEKGIVRRVRVEDKQTKAA